MDKRQAGSPLFLLVDVVVRLIALLIFSFLWATYLAVRGRSADWDFNMEGRIQATLWVYRNGVNSLLR